MKKIFTFLAFAMLIAGVYAQSPEKMSYQAVVRNSNEQLITNTQIGMQISILQGSENGSVVYSEVQNPFTNDNGLVSIEIGEGNSGNSFSEIDWGNGSYFLKTEVDISGGTDYTIAGTSQLLSVPYALYAKRANEIDPVFEQWGFDYEQLLNVPVSIDAFLLDANGNPITNVANPTSDSDVATKAYVDALEERIKALEVKDSLENSLFTDPRDDKIYKTVTIGTQTWMAENLAYLPEVQSASEFKIKNETETPGYAVYGYDGNSVAIAKSQNNYKTYGVLYNWYAVNQIDICPTGWHVPNEDEWQALEEFMISDGVHEGRTGVVLQATSGWLDDENGEDKYGFSALPGGGRYVDNIYGPDMGEGKYANWWSSTERVDNTDQAYQFHIYYKDGDLFQVHDWKSIGYSVRCVKD